MSEKSPDTRQVGVEITPEMIDAGTEALWEKTTLIEFPHPADRLGVTIILEAALRVQTAG